MRGQPLVEILSGMCGVQRKQMGPMAGGMLKFEISDVVVAAGSGEEDVTIDRDCVLMILGLLDDAPDLRDVYDEESFRRLAELAVD